MDAENSGPKGQVKPVHFGFSPGGDGFELLSNGQGWQGRELQDARRLAGLPVDAADAKELVRYLGDFHGHAVAVQYNPILGKGYRKGAFDVRIWAAASSDVACDPESLLHGLESQFHRGTWIARIAKLPAEQRRPWLLAVFKSLFGLRGVAALEGWPAVSQFSAVMALFPWPLVR